MVKNNRKIADEVAEHTYIREEALRVILPKYFKLDGLTLLAWKINWRQICDWLCEDEEEEEEAYKWHEEDEADMSS